MKIETLIFTLSCLTANSIVCAQTKGAPSATINAFSACYPGERDDVLKYIRTGPFNDQQRKSAERFACALDKTSFFSSYLHNKYVVKGISNEINEAVACIWQAFPSDKASKIITLVRDATINTRERELAYRRFNSALDGAVIKLPKNPICD